MNIKSLMALILQLVCLPAIANNSQETVEKQYQIYWGICSNTSLMQGYPQKARNACNKAIEADPNNPDNTMIIEVCDAETTSALYALLKKYNL